MCGWFCSWARRWRERQEHARERARGVWCCDCDVLLAPGAGRPVAYGYGAYADAPGARCARCYTLHWAPRLQAREAARRAIQDRHACGTEDSEERVRCRYALLMSATSKPPIWFR